MNYFNEVPAIIIRFSDEPNKGPDIRPTNCNNKYERIITKIQSTLNDKTPTTFTKFRAMLFNIAVKPNIRPDIRPDIRIEFKLSLNRTLK